MKFMIKVACIVGLVLLLGGFIMVFSKEEKQESKDEVKDNQTDLSSEASDPDEIPAVTQNKLEKSVFQIATDKVNEIIISNDVEKIKLLPNSPYSEEEVRTNLSGWFMHGPYKNVYSVKFNKMSDMLYGLEDIKPEKIIDEHEGNLDEFGLANVDFKITIGSGDREETILIGAPANNESRYAKLETHDRIFTINNVALEPYSYQAFDIVEKFVKIVAIDVLKQLTIQYLDQELVITVEHEVGLKSGFNVEINGNQIEENKFRKLYKTIAGLSVEEAIEDAKYDIPVATMIYTILDSHTGEKDVKVELIPHNDKSFAVFIDNKADFLIDKKKFIEMIEEINNQN